MLCGTALSLSYIARCSHSSNVSPNILAPSDRGRIAMVQLAQDNEPVVESPDKDDRDLNVVLVTARGRLRKSLDVPIISGMDNELVFSFSVESTHSAGICPDIEHMAMLARPGIIPCLTSEALVRRARTTSCRDYARRHRPFSLAA
jgi:hypothetical protein